MNMKSFFALGSPQRTHKCDSGAEILRSNVDAATCSSGRMFLDGLFACQTGLMLSVAAEATTVSTLPRARTTER